jgi:integrase
LTVQDLCNLFLAHQNNRLQAGEIKAVTYEDQKMRLRIFADTIGRQRLAQDLKAFDLMAYRATRTRAGKGPVTVNNEIAAIKAMFHWALGAELIERGPNLDAVKKLPRKRVERRTFTADEIHRLLTVAPVQWKAMIFLALNCSFGCTDCAELKWSNLDLQAGRIHFPRTKTGVPRDLALWPETVAALKAVPVKGEYVFYTSKGNQWGWRSTGKSYDKPMTKAFRRLMRAAGIQAEKGTGFYSLRRTSATIAAGTGDAFAVQGLLGHTDLKMASTYVQQGRLTPQTDRAIEHTRQWLVAATRPEDSGSP